ncbi:T9SS C-terminal target domain-containing protein [Bacteroides sp. 214]|nr:T9SS C-terminal target domain-containing protein [Bacteroides sp. 214]
MYAQVVKVDLNMSGRNDNEVNEPGYTPWTIGTIHTASMEEAGVTFTLTGIAPGTDEKLTNLRSSWSKSLVQSPYFMRLVNDGVYVENDALLAFPGESAVMELKISGLSVGQHTIQTYHNVWSGNATSTTDYAPLNVFLNGTLVHNQVRCSWQVKTVPEATCLLTVMNVTEEGQDMILRFEAQKDFTVAAGKTAEYNVYFNGFLLNVIDRSKQSCNPVPADRDIHVEPNNGSLTLKWEEAIDNSARSHVLYFGTDSIAVANATPASTDVYKGTFARTVKEYTVNDLYSMNNYFWRVDEVDANEFTNKGVVWKFRPRQLAFAGAEGYGRFATGGRGGRVVYVTNLNDSGEGSFRAAATDGKGPRTIVFAVSGIIKLESRLVMDPFVTVAGQTAPGKGICFRSAPIGVGKESIVRFIRSRLGAGDTADGMGMTGGNHSIMDHVSISWAIDEVFSSRGALNITLQRSLISEALNIAGHKNYGAGTRHGYAGSVGGDVASLHHNLLAHNDGRNWSMAGGLDGAGYYSGRLDIFNMVVYNWGGRTTDGGAHEVNFVNNYYKEGPATRTTSHMLSADLEGTGSGSQSYYYKGNVQQKADGTFRHDGTNDEGGRRYTLKNSQKLDWTLWSPEPFFPSYAKIETAYEAYKSVLSDVGCTMPVLDDHDVRVINETKNGTYSATGSASNDKGLIDHEDDAGGYEDYGNEVRPDWFDTDKDGLPNWWEALIGTNPNSPEGDFSDANADPNKEGITNLEKYLEWMANPYFYTKYNEPLTIDFAPYFVGYTANPVYSTVAVDGLNVSFTGSQATITTTATQESIYSFDVKVTDEEGATMTRRFGVNVNATGTGIEEVAAKKPDVEVYPTIFDSNIKLVLRSEKDKTVSVKLNDLGGRAVVSKNFEVQAGSNNLELNSLSSIPAQMYILQVVDSKTGHVINATKVIKK